MECPYCAGATWIISKKPIKDDPAETREGLLSIARTYDRLHVKYLGRRHSTISRPSDLNNRRTLYGPRKHYQGR
jgi:hypothetical protein